VVLLSGRLILLVCHVACNRWSGRPQGRAGLQGRYATEPLLLCFLGLIPQARVPEGTEGKRDELDKKWNTRDEILFPNK